MREPGRSPRELLARWRALGEDCRVAGPEGVIYVASSEIERFLNRSPSPEERDWVGLYRSLLPADFALTYHWAAGTYPPPYHFEYSIAVGAEDEGTITFWPDYPGEGVPEWRETYFPALGARIQVYNLLRASGLFAVTLEAPPERLIGGETAHLEVTGAGQCVEIPVHRLPEPDFQEIHAAVRALVPGRLWEDLEARRKRYVESTYRQGAQERTDRTGEEDIPMGDGYCAPDVSEGPAVAAAVVAREDYQAQLKDPTFTYLANMFLCWGKIQEVAEDCAEAGWAVVRAAWACDDGGPEYEEAATRCRLRAVDLFAEARRRGQPFACEPGAEEALLTDLLRRSGRFAEAEAAIEEGLAKHPPDSLRRLLLYQRQLCREGDIDAHTVDEVLQR